MLVCVWQCIAREMRAHIRNISYVIILFATAKKTKGIYNWIRTAIIIINPQSVSLQEFFFSPMI